MTPTAFYCVSDERYFLGAVGLVNSLRLVGHTEPVYLLDCGLSEPQRELIAPHVTLVRDQSGTPPWLLKTIAPLAHPATVMVLIDADMIVTRSLSGLLADAHEGRLVAVEHGRDRFCPEWGELLGLGEVRRGPYVSSGLLVADRELGTEVLALMDRLQDRVDFDRTFWRRNEAGYPFLYGDQDVLNAVLASARVDPDRVVSLDRRLEAIPPFAGLEVVDSETLRCAYEDGVEPYVLHHLSVKPWLRPTPDGTYTLLLRRLLLGDDVPIRVGERRLPLQLRDGLIADALRDRISGRSVLGSLRERIGRRR